MYIKLNYVVDITLKKNQLFIIYQFRMTFVKKKNIFFHILYFLTYLNNKIFISIIKFYNFNRVYSDSLYLLFVENYFQIHCLFFNFDKDIKLIL